MVRYLAACLLLLTGIIHVLSFALFNASSVTIAGMTVFGVIYFAIGIVVFWDRKFAFILGAIFPAIGIIMGTFGMISEPSTATVLLFFLIAIDVAVIVMCIYLLVCRKS